MNRYHQLRNFYFFARKPDICKKNSFLCKNEKNDDYMEFFVQIIVRPKKVDISNVSEFFVSIKLSEWELGNLLQKEHDIG